MGIIGIGTDIVSMARIEKIFIKYKKAFIRRILSEAEQKQYHTLKPARQLAYLAKRFAAKEAVVKALGTGFSEGIEFKQLSILNNPLGQPFVHYAGVAQQFVMAKGITQTLISLADEKDCALAFVVVS